MRPPAHLDLDAFFPGRVTVHAGDRIRFRIHMFHDVAWYPRRRAAPPLLVPDPGRPAGALRDAAGAPFWFDGLPQLIVNPAAARRAGGASFDGGRPVNSGLPPRDNRLTAYTLRFTRKGTLRFVCLVHPGMHAIIRVVGRRERADTPGEIRARTRARVRASERLAARLARFRPRRGEVLAGHDRGPVAWLRFFPEHLHVRVGQRVRFSIAAPREPHTVTIGPDAYTGAIERTLIRPAPDGTLVFDPLGTYPSDPPRPGAAVDFTGENHGNGFLNSGVLDTQAATPSPSSTTIRFARPGTYHYECVIHPGMDATVTVRR